MRSTSAIRMSAMVKPELARHSRPSSTRSSLSKRCIIQSWSGFSDAPDTLTNHHGTVTISTELSAELCTTHHDTPCVVHKKIVAQGRDAGKSKAGPPWRGDTGKPGSTTRL